MYICDNITFQYGNPWSVRGTSLFPIGDWPCQGSPRFYSQLRDEGWQLSTRFGPPNHSGCCSFFSSPFAHLFSLRLPPLFPVDEDNKSFLLRFMTLPLPPSSSTTDIRRAQFAYSRVFVSLFISLCSDVTCLSFPWSRLDGLWARYIIALAKPSKTRHIPRKCI